MKHWHIVIDNRGDWGVQKVFNSGGTTTRYCESEQAARDLLASWEKQGRCCECGEVLENEYCEPYASRILEEKLCFDCLFWHELVLQSDDPTAVRVGGRHYMIGEEPKRGHRGFLGHGGSLFDIAFEDGRRVVSRNLWTQGIIPEHFRERLPNNAVFIERRDHGPGYGHQPSVFMGD